MPILRIEQGDKLGMHRVNAAEITPEETADEIPVHGSVIPREMYVFQLLADTLQICFQFLYLGGLS